MVLKNRLIVSNSIDFVDCVSSTSYSHVREPEGIVGNL